MSKTAKKLLSVVLAVLVLAAGFSTLIGSFVMADDVDVFDYTTLTDIQKSDAFTFDENFTSKGSSQYTKTLYSDLGIHALNAILIESTDEDVIGLKVADGFFSSLWKGSETFSSQNTIGAFKDRSEIKAYITYAVEPGTSFTLNYLRYTDEVIKSKNINKANKNYDNLEFLVSSDGVNFVPVKAEFAKEDKIIASYNPWTATVKNVGATTRYLKVQFPQHTDDVSYAWNKEKNEWIREYVPQDVFLLQKTTFKKGTGLNEGEVKLLTTNADTSWKNNFLAAVKGVNSAINATTTGDVTTNAAGYNITNYGGYSGKAWGAISEVQRTVALKVQPGTRFTLRAQTSEHYFNQIRVALASQGYAEDKRLVEFFVYTSSGDNVWVQHRASVQNIAAYSSGGDFSNTGFTSYTIDFIVPQNHCYAKIVFPLEGAGNKVEYYVDGAPSGTFTGDTGATGNDLVKMQEVIYTPYSANAVVPTYNTSYDYTEESTANFDGANYFVDSPIDNKWYAAYGAIAGQNPSGIWSTKPGKTETYYLDKGIVPTGAKYSQQVGTATELNDDQLTYLVYEVAEDSYFEADVFMRKHTSNATWNVEGHDYYTKKGDFEFGVYTSDSLDGTWTKQGSLTYNCLITGLDTDNYYTFATYIPKGAKYVKFVLGLRGRTMYAPDGKATYDETTGYITGGTLANTTYGARYDDALGLRAVRYTSNSENHVTDTYSDWKCGDNYFAADGTTSIGGKAPNTAGFASDTGSIAKVSGVTVNNQSRSRYGMQVTWSSGGPDENRYVIYHVASGTTFNALGAISVTYHDKWNALNEGKDFEFEIYTAANLNATNWNLAYKTDTKVIEQRKERDIHNMEITVPAGHNYVKLVFPNLGTVSGDVGNYFANIYKVSYVPYTAVSDGAVPYNYTDSTTYPATGLNNNNKGTYGIYSFDNGSTSLLVSEKNGTGITPNYNALAFAWDNAKEKASVVYNVKPGTIFNAELYAASDTRLPWWSKETFTDITKENFEMEVYVSDSADGEWTLAATTLGETVKAVNVAFKVPENCSFVKVQFPQKGWVKPTINGNATEIRGNDLARLNKVSFVPCTENNYAKEETSFTDDNKVDYNLYGLNNVKANENGVVAADTTKEAFVEYKVSNEKALVVKAEGDLKIAVSYDGVKFTNAQIAKFDSAYTVNLVDGKQYVRVYLGEGDVITSVTAKHLLPTVTFVNAAGKTDDVDVPYGAIPTANLNTNRTGYKFLRWGEKGLTEGVYTDTVYEAKYAKDEENTFTIGLKEGLEGIAEISVNNDRTLDSVRFDDRVTAEAPATKNGDKFDKWVAYDLDGNKLGTISNSHKFSFLASASILLDAEYVNEGEDKTEDKPFIYNGKATITDYENGTWDMSVIWRVNTPADAEITETGILFSTTDLGTDEAWKTAAEDDTVKTTQKIKHSTIAANKTLMYTVTNIKAAKDARFALPYAIVNGKYVFGNVVSAQ